MERNKYEEIRMALEDLLEKCHHIDSDHMTGTFIALLKFDKMLQEAGVALYVTSEVSNSMLSSGNNMVETEGKIYLTQYMSGQSMERRYGENCLEYSPYLHFHYVDTCRYWAFIEYGYVPGEKAFYREWSRTRLIDACGDSPEAKRTHADLIALKELHSLFYTLWSWKKEHGENENIEKMIKEWRFNRCMLMPA